jgi:hypothetical protein
LAAHLGLRPLIPPAERPTERDLLALRRRHRELLLRDVAAAAAGHYPTELLFSMPVGEYVSELPALAREIARMAARARRGAVREFPAGEDLSRYPDYFRRNFHWQSDGYLSPRSAELYDAGVEFLFLGASCPGWSLRRSLWTDKMPACRGACIANRSCISCCSAR